MALNPGETARRGHMQFRTDIQILRAIAVLAVVLFHLQITGFASGFLGVDVFFVVSGFLMAKLYERNASPAEFYRRRAKRLLPVYFLTVFIVLIAAYWITLPPDFAQSTEQGLYASVFASNIGFWSQDSYFGKDNFTPFLHLWSLGVEVQYYLTVPLIFWLSRKFKPAIWLLTAGSLVLCLAMLNFSPKTSFFMMPLRFWEFGIGMLAARYAYAEPRGGFGLAAMIGIAAALFIPLQPEALSPVIGHPGLAAVLICMLTGAALMFGTPDKWFANLPGRIMQAIGNASYTIYLVHFPIIVLWFYEPFWGTKYGAGTLAGAWPALLMIILVSPLVYKLVERSKANWLTFKTALVLCLALAGTGWTAPALKLAGYNAGERTIFAAVTDRDRVRCGRLYRYENPGSEACVLAPENDQSLPAEGTVLLLGDSHSDAVKTSFAKAAAKHNYRTVLPISNDGLRRDHLGASWVKQIIETHQVSHIVLYLASENITPERVELARLAAAEKGIGLSLILPTAQEVPEVKLLGRLYEAERDKASAPTLPRIELEAAHRDLARYLAKHSGTIGTYDPNVDLCEGNICAAVNDAGQPLYFDNGHLSLTGARMLEPFFERSLADALASPSSK
jgi:peptidoglycan/LPS O-acetylase OafA/YrhL